MGTSGIPKPVPPDEFRVVAEHHIDPLFHAQRGVLGWIGPAVESTLGWTADDLSATSLLDLCHPEDLSGLEALLDRAAAGAPGRGVVRMRGADGAFVSVLLSVGPADPREGRSGVVGSLREINRRAEVERRLQVIAEQSPGVLYAISPDRRLSWVSPNVTRLLGWTPDELAGRAATELLHPDDQVPAEQALLAAFEGELADMPDNGVLMRIRRRDGGYLWSALTVALTLGADGRPDGAVGGLVDVSDMAARWRAVDRDASRLRLILDTLLDPYALLSPVQDEAGRIVDFRFVEINEAGAAYLNLSREDTIGASLIELMGGHGSAALVEVYASVMTTGVSVAREDFVYPARSATGSDRYFDVRAVRVDELLSVMWRDITERVGTASALAASEESYRLLAENASDVIVRTRDGAITWVSPSVTAMLGWSPAELQGREFDDLVHREDSDIHFRDDLLLRSTGFVVQRFRVRDQGGVYHWVEAHPRQYLDAQGRPDGIVASLRTIDTEVAAERELERRASHDDLTGLLSRKEILERIAGLSGGQRRTGSKAAVLFCDLDRFKEVNDTHGHFVGDAVLRETAARIQSCIRRGDIAARVGGDEILVLLSGVHSIADAKDIAEKVRRACAQPIRTNRESITATLSVGVTLAHPGESVDDLIARADRAMYQAKGAGRNRVMTTEA